MFFPTRISSLEAQVTSLQTQVALLEKRLAHLEGTLTAPPTEAKEETKHEASEEAVTGELSGNLATRLCGKDGRDRLTSNAVMGKLATRTLLACIGDSASDVVCSDQTDQIKVRDSLGSKSVSVNAVLLALSNLGYRVSDITISGQGMQMEYSNDLNLDKRVHVCTNSDVLFDKYSDSELFSIHAVPINNGPGEVYYVYSVYSD
jgi:hypothetical protein